MAAKIFVYKVMLNRSVNRPTKFDHRPEGWDRPEKRASCCLGNWPIRASKL